MFNSQYNTDNVLIRDVMLGLLDLLNRRVSIDQVLSDTEIKKISIPFFPFNYGQERFLQDFYYKYGWDCDGPTYAEGNADPVPRGVVHFDTFAIDSAALTNKFVRATYARPVTSDGQTVMQSFSAYVNPVPMKIQAEVEVLANTALESYKIIEAFVAVFYKARAYTVEHRGFPVETRVGFPNEYTVDKPTTFTYGDTSTITIKIPLEIETYLPVVDPTSEVPMSSQMVPAADGTPPFNVSIDPIGPGPQEGQSQGGGGASVFTPPTTYTPAPMNPGGENVIPWDTPLQPPLVNPQTQQLLTGIQSPIETTPPTLPVPPTPPGTGPDGYPSGVETEENGDK